MSRQPKRWRSRIMKITTRTRRLPAPVVVLGIVAVAGSLLLLPAADLEAAADVSPLAEGAGHTGLSVPAPVDAVVCEAAERPVALQQDPFSGQECVDGHGGEIPCPLPDAIRVCIEEATETLTECSEDAGFWGRVRCRTEYQLDVIACVLDWLGEVVSQEWTY